ncbi:MAG: GTP 3',8-cyclase MoaA [Candidatus Latescibacterota bacterium]
MTLHKPAPSPCVAPQDQHGRPMRSLRISVIDRCDLRCRYCMPEEEYSWLPRRDILTYDEIETLVRRATEAGVRRVRLTGGEPLLRPGLGSLVRRLAAIPLVEDLAMTTNGTRLESAALELRRAGLQRVTVSLDSLRRERFRQLTRRDSLEQVLAGIRRASLAGFASLKINTVVMRGQNDDELADLLEYGAEVGAEVRFIEYMDVGGATLWTQSQVVPRAEILERLQARYGPIAPDGPHAAAPAERFRLPDGRRFGIVASVSEPFCRNCDRSRVTADGMWYLCLYAREGTDLRQLLRQGDAEALVEVMRMAWQQRRDRGAEERRDSPHRGALYQVEELRQDPHREMHTRGG